MAKISVNEGNGPVAYDFPEDLTFREMSAIKRLTGLRAGELFPAMEAGDTDVFLAFAYIAKKRAGENVSEDTIADLPISAVDIDLLDDEQETDAGPPDEAHPVEPSQASS